MNNYLIVDSSKKQQVISSTWVLLIDNIAMLKCLSILP
jgi:hypothetical protein